MSTIAFLAFLLSYLIAPTNPVTWILMAATLCALAWDTKKLISSHKEAK